MEIYRIDEIRNSIICGDTLAEIKRLPDGCIDTIITSPPYFGLRDYNVDGQIGQEKSLDLYLSALLAITMEMKRVLKSSGVVFWNHGDAYASYGSQRFDKKKYGGIQTIRSGRASVGSYQAKCMLLQNFRLITKMIDEQGWILRNTLIWQKTNPTPSPVKDRWTNTYETVFMLTKTKRYHFDLDSIRVPLKQNSIDRMQRGVSDTHKYRCGNDGNGMAMPEKWNNPLGKNPGDIFALATQPLKEKHFASFPEKLIIPLIKAGCPLDGIVFDPFMGSGTVAVVAKKLNRSYLGIELNTEYCQIAEKRIGNEK